MFVPKHCLKKIRLLGTRKNSNSKKKILTQHLQAMTTTVTGKTTTMKTFVSANKIELARTILT